MQCQPKKEDDYDFLQEGRRQTEARMQKALARVKSMVQYPEARDQYRRLLAVVTDFQESKVALFSFTWICSTSMAYQQTKFLI